MTCCSQSKHVEFTQLNHCHICLKAPCKLLHQSVLSFFVCVNSGLIQREDTTRNSSSYIQKYAYMWRVPTSFTCERTFWTKSSTCWIAEPVEFLINDLPLIKWFDSVIFFIYSNIFLKYKIWDCQKRPIILEAKGLYENEYIIYSFFFLKGG